MNDATWREGAETEGIDEQEMRRRYYERLYDWSEPGATKVYVEGGLLETPIELD